MTTEQIQEKVNKMNEEVSVWDFVSQYYPGYTSSDEIAYNDDLTKILDNEDEPGSAARRILKEDYKYNRKSKKIQQDFDKSYIEILEKTIKGFMQNQGEKKNDVSYTIRMKSSAEQVESGIQSLSEAIKIMNIYEGINLKGHFAIIKITHIEEYVSL
jgi:hypothetical protein